METKNATGREGRTPMDTDRAREIGTCGGCGLVAREIHSRIGGTLVIQYEGGRAVHAAVKISKGNYIHFGSDESGFVEVEGAEFERACAQDFYPERLNLEDGEIESAVDFLLGDFS
jgi:hypothetical protein